MVVSVIWANKTEVWPELTNFPSHTIIFKIPKKISRVEITQPKTNYQARKTRVCFYFIVHDVVLKSALFSKMLKTKASTIFIS